QGAAALIALGVLRHLDVLRYGPDSADAIHLQAEAMKVAFAEAHRHIADADHMRVRVDELLDEDDLRERAGEIALDRASDPAPRIRPDRGTVYLAAADREGVMVSMIQSNYMGFGSGVVVPGTGIALQNRGAGFVLEEGHANRVGPNKRPYHTIIPSMVTRGGRCEMSFGVMGGHMQPQGHVQMALRVLGWGQNVQAASDAPRWHVTEGFDLALERGTNPRVVESLRKRGHRIVETHADGLFGGAQLIRRLEDGVYVAGSDHRKEGMAVGY
ncbi:MAG: gamma-glutamyltransferase family protein, partial [Planctomycetota bacterium]